MEKGLIKIIFAALIPIVIGILLPEKMQELLANYVEFVFIRYIFQLETAAIFLLMTAATFFFLRRKCIRSKLIGLAISVASSIILYNVYLYVIPYDFRQFTVGCLGFYKIDDDGKLTKCKEGVILNKSLIEAFDRINNEKNSTLTRMYSPKFSNIELTNYESSKYTYLNIGSLFNSNYFSKKYDIIVYGIFSENGEIGEFNILHNDNSYIDEDFLGKKTSSYINDLETFICNAVKSKPLEIKGEIAAELIFSFVTQSFAGNAVSILKDISIGETLLSESKNIIDSVIYKFNINMQKKDIDNIMTPYDLNYIAINLDNENYDEAIKYMFKILKKNPYYPFDNYDEFKTNYNMYYLTNVSQKTLNIAEKKQSNGENGLNADDLKIKLKINEYKKENFLIENFAYLIAGSKNYHENLKMFEELSKEYPTNAIVYIAWGDAIKLYKSEPFNLNLSVVDNALSKYYIAEKLDSDWILIGTKIYITTLLQIMQEKSSGNNAKAEEKKIILKKYENKLTEFSNTQDFKKFFRGRDN